MQFVKKRAFFKDNYFETNGAGVSSKDKIGRTVRSSPPRPTSPINAIPLGIGYSKKLNRRYKGLLQLDTGSIIMEIRLEERVIKLTKYMQLLHAIEPRPGFSLRNPKQFFLLSL